MAETEAEAEGSVSVRTATAAPWRGCGRVRLGDKRRARDAAAITHARLGTGRDATVLRRASGSGNLLVC